MTRLVALIDRLLWRWSTAEVPATYSGLDIADGLNSRKPVPTQGDPR